MNKSGWKQAGAVILLAVLLGGCGGAGTSNNGNQAGAGNAGNGTGEAAPQACGQIRLAYVAWDSEIASTYVVKEVLEQKLGCQVELLQVDAGPMFAGISDGSADAMVAAWLPTTHAAYIEQYGDQLVDLGPNLNGTRIGLVVPQYMEIASIDQLASDAAVGDAVQHRIIGIEPGAGIMMSTRAAMDTYGLEDWTLLESSSAAMAQELDKAYRAKEPIVVTGWTPHWMFAKMELKYLEDPQNVYGGAEQIHTMTRKGLESDMPEAAAVLDRFEWTPEDMAEVMLEIADGEEPQAAAKAWVDGHPDKVGEWVGS
ncbi:glycine betaine ABC transporter substrate-binding protein [Paenibacillus sp. IB182496]|uniref:Glycine betaine ABC transporter substrate-binding protein n=1 Tax=Paenibacillus sabuli TaxID=2772509 RepID=A0A927BUB6_9BACL|nr:glycine betaine ABC transporter substrate-binding protein [Paenibacillus sabuli]MBD2846973.1 glycine betaine ABC transporter substrate-binding protein [Paenibacillus sabuli]